MLIVPMEASVQGEKGVKPPYSGLASEVNRGWNPKLPSKLVLCNLK